MERGTMSHPIGPDTLFVAGARRKRLMDCHHYFLLVATGRQGRLVKRDKIEKKYKKQQQQKKEAKCSLI